MQLRRLDHAFTLVELIMVVVLIGVIAIFAIPGYTKSVAKSYEKAGTNNLMIIYSAQKLKYNSGGSYQVGANTAALNTALSLGVIGNGVAYSCSVAAGPTFDCRAAYGAFELKVLDSNSTVCCSGAPCPSVANCI